jgi:Leucine-rich repeat (LRR) protein
MITLDLSKTKLRNLPPTLYKLTNLQVLKLDTAHNKLEEDIMKLTKLK